MVFDFIFSLHDSENDLLAYRFYSADVSPTLLNMCLVQCCVATGSCFARRLVSHSFAFARSTTHKSLLAGYRAGSHALRNEQRRLVSLAASPLLVPQRMRASSQAKGERILILCWCPLYMLGILRNTGEIDRDFFAVANLASCVARRPLYHEINLPSCFIARRLLHHSIS